MTDKKRLTIFASILTEEAPSSNYRGESPTNHIVLQTIHKPDGNEYAMVSAEAIRNGIRELMPRMNLPVGRERLLNETQLSVKFSGFPSDEQADHFFMGWMVADSAQIKANQGKPFRRESRLLCNNAVALYPHEGDEQILQSPRNVDGSHGSALLHREITYTSFQWPFVLPLRECYQKPEWTRRLLLIIAQLSKVAGGHTRSYFEMAPKSIVLRLTPHLASGMKMYGYDQKGYFTPLDRIGPDDLPGEEFWMAGAIVRTMADDKKKELQDAGVKMFSSPVKCMEALGEYLFGPEPMEG